MIRFIGESQSQLCSLLLPNQFAERTSLSQGRSPLSPSMSSSRSFARSTGCAAGNEIFATAVLAAAKNERVSFIPKDNFIFNVSIVNQVACQEMPHAVLRHISRSYVIFLCAKPMSLISATACPVPNLLFLNPLLPVWTLFIRTPLSS